MGNHPRYNLEYKSKSMNKADRSTGNRPFVLAWMHDMELWGRRVADDIERLEIKAFGKAQNEPGDPPPPPPE